MAKDLQDLQKRSTVNENTTSSNDILFNIDSDLMQSLPITDVINIHGAPHQFTSIADPRININNPLNQRYLGRVYTKYIIRNMPLLLITPGVPRYAGASDWGDRVTLSSTAYGGKYYYLEFAYTTYYRYVDTMLRAAVAFLGIENEQYAGKTLGTVQWGVDLDNSGVNNHTSVMGQWFNNFLGKELCKSTVPFYADFGPSSQDSLSNTSTSSSLASTINSYSDKFREWQFTARSGASLSGTSFSENDPASHVSNDKSLAGILDKVRTVLSGGRLVFPKIWSDSSFSRSYTANMKLVSPSGDKISIFFNILVPLFHVLALTLPRQDTGNDAGYVSPFLVRAYYKGMFNIDLGLISSLSITKGAEGEWTKDGLPTVVDISFEIEDLYQAFYMSMGDAASAFLGLLPLKSSGEGGSNLTTNITELDYIANMCGINVNNPNDIRMGRLLKLLNFDNTIRDVVNYSILGRFSEWINTPGIGTLFSRLFNF